MPCLKKLSAALRPLVATRFGGLTFAFLVWIVLSFLLRVFLTLWSWNSCDHSPLALLTAFAVGFLLDCAGAAYAAVLPALYLAVIPQSLFAKRWHQQMLSALLVVAMCCMVFSIPAEIFFWEEFTCRFNFIAVDYLVYTTEVLDNIWQSYPVVWLVLGVVAIAGAFYAFFKACGALKLWFSSNQPWKTRMATLGSILAAALLCLFFLPDNIRNRISPENCVNQELAGSGPHDFCAAYFNNQLTYERFYATLPTEKAAALTRAQLPDCLPPKDDLDITHQVTATGPEHNWNVILVVCESLSAEFTSLSTEKSRTPNFDKMMDGGIVLERLFATGTRTVRGLEAVTLSLPPTPGQSILRRPGSENMFSLSTLFRAHGYDCTFLYGGYGVFDNMNDFFQSNGYEILDRASDLATPQTFSNAWGVCDEDIYQWALADADRSFQHGKPFHQLILLTSNHRPYTFPEGAIDAPQKRRSSAVKYTDHAIGKFIRDAEGHPWFDNTLFVFVADHCHSTSGRKSLPLGKYHIPALFYNPKLVAPRRVNKVCSQMDIAPTIFGLLNWSYESQFMGRDVLKEDGLPERAFLGTFQKLGRLDAVTGIMTILSPNSQVEFCQWELTPPFNAIENAPVQDDASLCTAFYQVSSQRFQKRAENATSPCK